MIGSWRVGALAVAIALAACTHVIQKRDAAPRVVDVGSKKQPAGNVVAGERSAAAENVSSGATAAAPLSATVVRPSEMTLAVATRRDSLVGRGQALRADEVGYYMDVQEARFRQIASGWLRISRQEHRVLLSLPGTVSFDVGSAILSPRALDALGSVAKVLMEYRHTVVSLHGHTDNAGNPTVNQHLSEERALAVARAMVAAGVAAERIIVAGYGAETPAATNSTAEGREANRRVEIEVTPLVKK